MSTLISTAIKLLPRPLQRFREQIKASPLGSRLARGSFWSLAGSLISRALALAAGIVTARILGKTGYGELGVIQTTIGMFGTVAGFGMGTTASKFVAEFRGKDPAKAGRIIALSSTVSWCTGLLLGLVLVSVASWLARTALAAPQLTPYVQLSALLLLLNGVNGAQTGVLSGFEAFHRIAGVNALTGMLNFPLVIGGAALFGLAGVVLGMILAQAIGCLVNYLALRREAARHGIFIEYWSWTTEFPILWQFAVPAVLGGLLMSPASWVCTAMLAHQPEGLGQVGALNAANQWLGAVVWLPFVLAQASLPMFAERIGANDKIRSAKLLAASIKINVAVALPVVLVGSIFSSYIMSAYGKDFASDWPTLVAALVSGGFAAVQIPVGNIIAASGRMWLGFCMNLLWSLVLMGAAWLLLRWGSLGVASAHVLAYIAQGIWACAYAAVLIRRIGRCEQTE